MALRCVNLAKLAAKRADILHTIYADRVGKSLKTMVGIKAVVAKSEGVGKLIDRVRSLTDGSVTNHAPSNAPRIGEKLRLS